MIMFCVIGYIIGMVITILLRSWHLSKSHDEIYRDDCMWLFIDGLFAILSFPIFFVIRMSKLIQGSLRFMFHKIKKVEGKKE